MMTRVTDDLEIFDSDLAGKNSGVLGQCGCYVVIDDREGNGHPDGHVIRVQSSLEDEKLVHIVCHELEHYDIVKCLLSNGALTTKQLLSFSRSREGVYKQALVEWAHSNPCCMLESKGRR